MPKQFHTKTSSAWCYAITYQSNNALNKALSNDEHVSAKVAIAKHLTEKFTVLDIHSYMHSHIVFSVVTQDPIDIFNKIAQLLEKPMSERNPSLLFSVTLVAKSKDTNYLHMEGSDDMDSNFKKSISDFYPKKSTASKE